MDNATPQELLEVAQLLRVHIDNETSIGKVIPDIPDAFFNTIRQSCNNLTYSMGLMDPFIERATSKKSQLSDELEEIKKSLYLLDEQKKQISDEESLEYIFNNIKKNEKLLSVLTDSAECLISQTNQLIQKPVGDMNIESVVNLLKLQSDFITTLMAAKSTLDHKIERLQNEANFRLKKRYGPSVTIDNYVHTQKESDVNGFDK